VDKCVKRTRSGRRECALHTVEETTVGKMFWICEFEEEDTIENFKLKIAKVMQRRKMMLSHRSGAILEDRATMRDYGMKNGSRLYLTWANGAAVLQPCGSDHTIQQRAAVLQPRG
jgi:hypothetical protein